MSQFNYKDFLKNSSFLNEVEETEEKFSVDKLEDKVKAILKKEGGAVGVKPLVDAAKELGASKKDLMDVLEKMKSVETHKDGDIIDTDGLKEDRKAKEYIQSIEDEDEREEEKKRMFGDDIEEAYADLSDEERLIVGKEYDHEIIAQAYLNKMGKDSELSSDDLLKIGKKVVFLNYDGDMGAAYKDLVKESTDLMEDMTSLYQEKQMVMKLLLDKMQEIASENREELTRDFLIKTKNMIDDLIISDF